VNASTERAPDRLAARSRSKLLNPTTKRSRREPVYRIRRPWIADATEPAAGADRLLDALEAKVGES
jgi:hypothetical protein